MFAKFVSAAWGDDTGKEADAEGADDQVASVSSDSSGKQPAASKTLTVAVPSVWGVAASLADTVKRNTAEITAGLKETNWRAEIEAFGKGVREEEQVLRHETAKRVEVAKEHFPKDATAQLDHKRKELTVHLQKMGVGLGTFGKRVVTRTTDLFDQVKDSLVEELSASGKATTGARHQPSKLPKASNKYSRLEADISSMQRDSATYCDEPADNADYQAWRANFDLAGYRPAVEALTQENTFMAELQARIVPVIVEYDAFWTRYFYQLHLLEARHAQRMELAQRASKPREEELGWDDADDQLEATPPPHLAHQSPSAHLSASSEQQVDQSQHTGVNQPQLNQQKSEEQTDSQHKLSTEQQEDKQIDESARSSVPQAVASDSAAIHEQDVGAAAVEEDTPDAVTNSDSGSATEHWTVVTSPSKQTDVETKPFGHTSDSAAVTEPKQQARNADEGTVGAAATQAARASPVEAGDDNDDIDDLDDVANDESPGSEGEEDWGSWE